MFLCHRERRPWQSTEELCVHTVALQLVPCSGNNQQHAREHAAQGGRDALDVKGPQRRPQKRLDKRLEEGAKAVGGGDCRLRMTLTRGLAVRGTVAGRRLGALEGGVPPPPPLTRKRHTMPHSAQPQHTKYWAPRTRKRHQQEHRPQRPTESSDPTQHVKGRTGDCPGPRKETTTRRNVAQGGTPPLPIHPCRGVRQPGAAHVWGFNSGQTMSSL